MRSHFSDEQLHRHVIEEAKRAKMSLHPLGRPTTTDWLAGLCFVILCPVLFGLLVVIDTTLHGVPQ